MGSVGRVPAVAQKPGAAAATLVWQERLLPLLPRILGHICDTDDPCTLHVWMGFQRQAGGAPRSRAHPSQRCGGDVTPCVLHCVLPGVHVQNSYVHLNSVP